jgi:hypothetical protein
MGKKAAFKNGLPEFAATPLKITLQQAAGNALAIAVQLRVAGFQFIKNLRHVSHVNPSQQAFL